MPVWYLGFSSLAKLWTTAISPFCNHSRFCAEYRQNSSNTIFMIKLGVKRRTFLYYAALQDILDLTDQNDAILNFAKLGIFSIYLSCVGTIDF
jgi:hypothetical protein